MSRMTGAATARAGLLLALVLGAAVAVVMPSLFATTVESPQAMVLAAVATAVAALVGLDGHVATRVAGALRPRPRIAEDAPSFLAERVADPVHHPLRPRAPGPV